MKSARRRIRSIDQVRGLAVIAMIFSHGLRWLYSGRSQDVISIAGSNSIGDFATPVFFVISGMGLGLMAVRKGLDWRRLGPRFARLFAIGMFLTFSWGVLQAQAVALLVILCAYLLDRNVRHTRHHHGDKPKVSSGPTHTVAPIAGISLLLHIVVRKSTAADASAWNHFFIGDFPIFAVITLVTLGFLYADQLHTPMWARRAVTTGAAAVATGIVLHVLRAPLERSAMSPSFIALGFGVTLILIGLFDMVGRTWRIAPVSRLLAALSTTGNHSLYLFVFHYIIVALPLHASGLAGTFTTNQAIIGALPLTAILIQNGLKNGIENREMYARFDRFLGWIRSLASRVMVSSGQRR